MQQRCEDCMGIWAIVSCLPLQRPKVYTHCIRPDAAPVCAERGNGAVSNPNPMPQRSIALSEAVLLSSSCPSAFLPLTGHTPGTRSRQGSTGGWPVLDRLQEVPAAEAAAALLAASRWLRCDQERAERVGAKRPRARQSALVGCAVLGT